MSETFKFVSSLTYLLIASFIVSPNSICPPGRPYFLRHFGESIKKILPFWLKTKTPTIASGYFCLFICFILPKNRPFGDPRFKFFIDIFLLSFQIP